MMSTRLLLDRRTWHWVCLVVGSIRTCISFTRAWTFGGWCLRRPPFGAGGVGWMRGPAPRIRQARERRCSGAPTRADSPASTHCFCGAIAHAAAAHTALRMLKRAVRLRGPARAARELPCPPGSSGERRGERRDERDGRDGGGRGGGVAAGCAGAGWCGRLGVRRGRGERCGVAWDPGPGRARAGARRAGVASCAAGGRALARVLRGARRRGRSGQAPAGAGPPCQRRRRSLAPCGLSPSMVCVWKQQS
jgi:hypothetical protein